MYFHTSFNVPLDKSVFFTPDSHYKIGTGVFGLSDEKKQSLKLTDKESELIKPYFTSEQFSRYYANHKNKLWLIYTSSKFKNRAEILPFPNIKKHLDKFQKIITSDNKPYGLHRARDERFFIGEKLIVQRKCPNKPVFTYTDFDTYVSATFYIIKTNRLNQKYLVGILNSKLIEFWLKNKGKMQGNNFQLDKEPLVNIPLINANNEIQKNIANKIEQILSFKKQNPEAESGAIESEIDKLVYKLYDLTEKEIKIIEKATA